MKIYENTTIDGLKAQGIPTFNMCEHFLVKPLAQTMQTLVIDVGNGKYLIININPESDNIDVKMFGEHKFSDFGTVKAFFNMAGAYDNAI